MGKYIPVGALQSDLRLDIGLAPAWAQVVRAIGVVEPSSSGVVDEFVIDPASIYDTSRNDVLSKTLECQDDIEYLP